MATERTGTSNGYGRVAPHTIGRRGPSAAGSPWPAYRSSTGRALHLRIVFGIFFLVSMTNAIGLFITYVRNVSDQTYVLGAYPIAFAVSAVIIVAFSKGRQLSPLLMGAWFSGSRFSWEAFLDRSKSRGRTLGERSKLSSSHGLLSSVCHGWPCERSLRTNCRGFLRHRRGRRRRRLLDCYKSLSPAFFSNSAMGPTERQVFGSIPIRVAWFCAIALFISLMSPFQHKPLNWIARSLLIAGVAASFSRASIFAFVVGWLVYGIAAKRFGTLLKSLIVLILFVAAMLVTLEVIDAVSPDQTHRLGVVRKFLEGDWAEDSDNRTGLWKQTFLAIEAKGGIIFGLGHGSMLRVVGTAEGGLLAQLLPVCAGKLRNTRAIALVVFEGMLFQQAWKCQRAQVCAALLAIATIIASIHIFDHSFIGYPFTGVILACIMLASAYGRSPVPGTARLCRQTLVAGLPAPRSVNCCPTVE